MAQTITVNIPKLAIDAFRKLADACKRNVKGFSYSVGAEHDERYGHLCDYGSGKHVEYMMHTVHTVEITMPEENDWRLLATYEDGLEFVTDPSKELVPSNPEHGKKYRHCDVCGHWCKNSYLIVNVVTGEELQVGIECSKKFGLNYTRFLSRFTSSLYSDFILKFGTFDLDMGCPMWGGGEDKWAFSCIEKVSLICAAREYFKEHPTWIKATYESGRGWTRSESNEDIQRILIGGDFTRDEEYVKAVCDYTLLTAKADSEFGEKMHKVATDFYATPSHAVQAFFMVKNYEDYVKSKELNMERFAKGLQLHVVGKLVDVQTEQGEWGLIYYNTIKTDTGVVVKRTGKVPYTEGEDGVKTVDFYALIKFTKGVEIHVDRALKHPKKGIEVVRA